MSEAPAAQSGLTRIVALLAVALFIIVPVTWIGWSSYEASLLQETVDGQSALAAGLRERLAALGGAPGEDAAGSGESIYLPGETPAIAGAALQKLVGDTVEGAGGHVLESEFRPADESENDPGRVDLRVSFDTEIAGLQRILFALETGSPFLMTRNLDVRSVGAAEVASTESPPLRVVLLVGAYLEAAE
jgi:hypothetical protein